MDFLRGRVVLLVLVLVSACIATRLPIVDLGYELHQAYSYNETSGLYNFSNIRYAAPPVGNLRWRPPVAPTVNRSVVHTGSRGRICPQATPMWETDIAPDFVVSVIEGVPYTGPTNISSFSYTPGTPDPRTTEDCLFLDIVVPKKIFDRSQNKTSVPENATAPVLVWIFGGGYTSGDKSEESPTGLIERSLKGGKEGIVFVALNYRLGAFGWLAGSSLTGNGTANAALYDQRFALDWVYKNIHLFGGNPNRVTVMGESAGGGSIEHQITAFGGSRGPAPFQQAILQSPGWYPVPEQDEQEDTLQEFLGLLNVSTIAQARSLPSSDLIAANAYQVAKTQLYGTFKYGPVVDGVFAPELPGMLLLEGRFDHNLSIMVGHNANEGLAFTPPYSVESDGLELLIKSHLPEISANAENYITNVLYPANYSGLYGYNTTVGRSALTIGDLVFSCNTDYLNRAYGNDTYAYMFSIPPAIHGQDVPYTFYTPGVSSASDVESTYIADVMQDYFTSFVETGVPNSTIGPVFEKYGARGRLLNLGLTNITAMQDPTRNPRCKWWQKGLYFPHN
ncbi:hypothetical protein ASPZODRAFT_152607 [Penicilliopsis zonata CBS 506.65]|uniref:Carboxylic ester hydrolase n=1 Tax=Penicilliopsis zonata CBS 506.65 TaxID=1073090 RepID=A0A1L9SEE3_9EURO|nr:hypothetical protein ASPZODRAFT_152607 [Penicilliopsis zonata CBS 506.65]OJJ45549.1 hypothetical protein ASPZODRAFT_152607 [Penicilliopsis zonata CBS 506.65]